jgi:carboxyl-terminal processing protease
MKLKWTIMPLALLVALLVGIWWGGHPAQLPSFVRSALVANPSDSVISDALSDIQHDYFRPVARSGLIGGSIAGAVASLGDPYAQYEPPAAYGAFANPKPQHFSGIGIDVISTHAGLSVQGVLPGTPAAQAGLRAGDLITAVGRRSLVGLANSAATGLIRGRPGTSVTLAVSRGARRLTITVRREVISAPAQLVLDDVVTYKHVPIGYIELSTFDVPGIHTQFAQALRSLLARHVKAIVLDLRDNGGGLVVEAQLIASMFIRSGVIVTTRGRTQPTETIYAVGHPLAPKLPMAVLVNGDTASAAEIVTGALQDHHRALVVGTRTYGKGVFQEVRELANGGAIDITVGQYYLPDGENLGRGGFRRGAGIKPNLLVSAAPSAKGDPQLQAALRALAARAR